MTLRPYQQHGIDLIAKKVGEGCTRILFQLPTGAGKTVTFSALINRYRAKFNKRVLVLVHRDVLAIQTRDTLKNFGLNAALVQAGDNVPFADIYVSMVETANNRLRKNSKAFGDIGMVIIDECHIGNFKKLFDYFNDQIIVGFSATPISGSKKTPLKDYYTDIISTVQIKELIEIGALAPNITYGIKGINRSSFKIKNGEFDNASMGTAYSKSVKNTLEVYQKNSDGKKTMIFNCNVEHNELVNQTFLDAGYASKIMIGDTNKAERDYIFDWFKNTPNAVLQNVAVLTAGFDEPSVETIIINRSTMSLSLWLQMTGRGSRPYDGKDFFQIIDMGGNAVFFGDWSQDRDWNFIFENPEKWREGNGVAPVKECKHCEAIIHASSTICKYCGGDNKKVVVYDKGPIEIELICQNFDVQKMVDKNLQNGYKQFAEFYKMLGFFVAQVAKNPNKKADIYKIFRQKSIEWHRIKGIPFTAKQDQFTKSQFEMKLR